VQLALSFFGIVEMVVMFVVVDGLVTRKCQAHGGQVAPLEYHVKEHH
jgi:hypothetical protein